MMNDDKRHIASKSFFPATTDWGLARRQFLKTSGMGLGAAVLGSLLPQNAQARNAASTGEPARAKRVIFLFMAGAPSQLDLFDYKPDLDGQFKKPLPPSVSMGQRVTAMTKGKEQLVAPSMYKFDKQGESGIWMCELFPHLSKVADDLCIVNSFHTNAINHDPAKTFICTGAEIPGRPSMGAWISYGLGTMNADLPDFIVLNSAFWTGGTRNTQALYSRLWGSGPLPSLHQGVKFQTAGDPVLFLSNPRGINPEIRRRMLDTVGEINRGQLQAIGDPEIETTIAQQEMAFRMQSSVPELTDVANEPQHILDLYGPEVTKPGSFARNCLLARRMIERDVRFIQIYHRGWDHHTILPQQLPGQCYDIDQPCAALIQDLKNRGLLDDTMIVLTGEFGRTTYCQGTLERDNYGRDHHPRCFSGFLAGGGIKGGMMHGQTDDFSYNVVADAVSIPDLHATMLHQLGGQPRTADDPLPRPRPAAHRRRTLPRRAGDPQLNHRRSVGTRHRFLSSEALAKQRARCFPSTVSIERKLRRVGALHREPRDRRLFTALRLFQRAFALTRLRPSRWGLPFRRRVSQLVSCYRQGAGTCRLSGRGGPTQSGHRGARRTRCGRRGRC